MLLLRHDRVGDMIMTTGLLRELSAHRPGLIIDVLASPANASIARRQHAVGEVIEHPQAGATAFLALVRRLRRSRYDAVVDAFVLRRRVNMDRALLMLACGARRRVGIGGRENDFVYTHGIALPDGAPRHHVEVLGMLARFFDLDPSTLDLRPQLDVSDTEHAAAEEMWARAGATDPARRVLVNVSAGGDALRRWPDERFSALLASIRERHPRQRMLAVSLPAERDALQRMAAPTGVATACPSLWEAFALVRGASLFVTPDTGLAHAASAFGTRTITLSQPGKEAWMPWRTPGRSVVAPEGPGLASLAVASVAEAVAAELGAAGSR